MALWVLGLSYPDRLGGNMQVGDLVRWPDGEGGYELGMVTDCDGDGYGGIMVYFLLDGKPSCVTKKDLEVVNENENR